MKPYLVLIPESNPKKFIAINRCYNWIPDEYVDTDVDISRIVQVDRFEGYPYLSRPVWWDRQDSIDFDTEIFIALWFNYYD